MRKSRGFTIVSAIFILVVLAALGAFIVTVSTSQQTGSALDVQGVRAYQAARAGVEWGLYQVQATTAYNFSYGNPATSVGAADPDTRACPTSPTTLSNLSSTTFNSLTVTVTCVRTPGTSGGPAVYVVTGTACNQPVSGACPNTTSPGPFYVERRLEVVL